MPPQHKRTTSAVFQKPEILQTAELRQYRYYFHI